MEKPMLLINTKAYREGIGQRVVSLARACRKLSSRSRAEIVLAVQPYDIPLVSKIVTTFAQHIDAVEPGARTGHILPEGVKSAGVRGTLISHSECRLGIKGISQRVERARELGLVSVVCAPTPLMVRKIANLRPDYIAIEPPELIGKGISVSQAKPSVITKSVKLAGGVKVLTGAGISTGDDVSKAMELGTHGVLVASGIVKSAKPEKAVSEILRGFG